MIKIFAKLVLRPECVEHFQTIAKELVEKSLAEEGCVTYSLNRSKADPNTFAFIEIWKDQEAIDIHNASEHFTRIVPQFDALLAQPTPAEFFEQVWG